MGEYVGVDPDEVAVLARRLGEAGAELEAVEAEVAAALASVGQASFAPGELAMVATWLEARALDLADRLVELDDPLTPAPLRPVLAELAHPSPSWWDGGPALELRAKRDEAAALVAELDRLRPGASRLPGYLERRRASLREAVAALDDLVEGRLHDDDDDSALASFLTGAVVGDFAHDDSWGAVAGQTAVGLVPIAGQVADGRDIVAALMAGAWGRLVVNVVAIVPGLDLLKGGSKLGRRAIRDVFEQGLSKTAAQGVDVLATRVGPKVAKALERRVLLLQVYRQESIIRLDDILRHQRLSAEKVGRVESARNALRDHLSDTDLVGALRDLAHIPVSKGSGVFDHLTEVEETAKSVKKCLDAMKEALPPPIHWNRAATRLSWDMAWLKATRQGLEEILPGVTRTEP